MHYLKLFFFPTQTQITQKFSGDNNLILNIFFTENDPGNGFILYEEEKTQLPLGKKILYYFAVTFLVAFGWLLS